MVIKKQRNISKNIAKIAPNKGSYIVKKISEATARVIKNTCTKRAEKRLNGSQEIGEYKKVTIHKNEQKNT